jgi:organic radical activating enzyme
MTRMRKDGKDCERCFLRGCDCECKTCREAYQRNMGLTSKKLDEMNLMDALGITESSDGETIKSPS